MSLHEVIDSEAVAPKVIWPDLPVVTPETLFFQSNLAGRTLTARASIGAEQVQLTGPVGVSKDHHLLTVTCRIGQKSCHLMCPENALGLLLDAHGIKDNWQDYGAETAAIVFEHLMTTSIGKLEKLLDAPIQIIGWADDEGLRDENELWFTLKSTNDIELPFAICGSTEILLPLIDAMTADTPEPVEIPLDQTPFEVRLSGPSFAISHATPSAISIGDAFLLEADWNCLTSAKICVADHLYAHARVVDDRFTLGSSFETSQQEDIDMSQTDAPPQDTLPVTIAVELGQTTLTLAELRDLKMGDVLPFSSELPTNVALSANGKAFGRGDLVRFDGKVAIRITEIA